MAVVYSHVLIWGLLPYPSGLGYTVPDGFVAVVRDIDIYNDGGAGGGLAGFIVYTDSGTPIWQRKQPFVRYQKTYSWRGRQVLTAGDTLECVPFDPNWQARISGYLLTAP
jgi:hypothetical protein